MDEKIFEKSKSSNKFFKFWFKELTPQQRQQRIERAFIPIKKVGQKQVDLLNKHEKSIAIKEFGFLYFISTVRGIWDNIEFAISLGKGKNRCFSFYPTRSVVENLLRLEHYCCQKKEGQNDIALRELMRIAKRFYEREKIENQTGESYKTMYEDFTKEGLYPSIENAKTNDDPFPSIKDLAKISSVNKDHNLYLIYQSLAELSHGKLLSVIQRKQDDLAEHIRSLMELLTSTYNLIKLVDLHIKGVTKKEVVEALKVSETIIKKGM